MKRTTFFLLLALLTSVIKSQSKFVTIVPQRPIIVGEAFQVQYVLEDGKDAINFTAPVFQHFRVAAGPDIYPGTDNQSNKLKKTTNFVFTLVALTTGKYNIPGATLFINGRQIRSNNIVITIISKEAAAGRFDKEQLEISDYFLRPGEDVQEKIRQNLFMKLMVDKNSCFVGEPVVATFKLYSRLQSRSDIVKNPGFYGFTVQDMVNLSDKEMSIEKVKGKIFDVHTLRKVALYPLQSGIFIIDAMDVKNTIEFSRSAVNKKTEQEIVEGVLIDEEKEVKKENTEEYESAMHTLPISIQVKPLPEKNKPFSFDGATGIFTISANLVNNDGSKDDENVLEITIRGKGNFIQMNPPVVKWPRGIEGFDPMIKDSLSKLSSPLTGSRTFRYPFVAAASGSYLIPAVSFSFFNTAINNYKTISTIPLQVSIDRKSRNNISDRYEGVIRKKSSLYYYWILSGGMLLLLGCLYWFIRNKKINASQSLVELAKRESLSVAEIVAPAFLLLQADDQLFYSSLQHSICNYFGVYFNLTGSEMNKENIATKLRQRKVDKDVIVELNNILQQCEAGIFNNASLKADKELLLAETKDVLEKINKFLF